MNNAEFVIQPKGDEITVRHGQSPKPVEKQPYQFSGDIKAPFEFLDHQLKRILPVEESELDSLLLKKYEQVSGTSVCEVISKDGQVRVIFRMGIGWDDQATVTGDLLPDPVLQQLNINAQKEFAPRELSDLLKRNRVLFDDREKNAEIVAGLRDLKARVERDLEEKSDKRGNERKLDDKQVTTGLPEGFVLNCPVFKGGEPRKFLVELCVDVRSGGVSIWLESVELIEIMRQQVEDVSHAAKDSFGKYMPVLCS